MIKVYNIGRDASQCEIVIDDPSNISSSRHAVLKIDSRGKYSIVDCSTNGTYVNGLRIEPGVETPVTRKDQISFAHVVDFDWDLIPNPARKRRIVALSIISAVVLLASLAFAALEFAETHRNRKLPAAPAVSVQTDSVCVKDTAVQADTTAVRKPVEKQKTFEKKKPVGNKAAPAPKKSEAQKPADNDDTKTSTEEVTVEKKVTNPIL